MFVTRENASYSTILKYRGSSNIHFDTSYLSHKPKAISYFFLNYSIRRVVCCINFWCSSEGTSCRVEHTSQCISCRCTSTRYRYTVYNRIFSSANGREFDLVATTGHTHYHYKRMISIFSILLFCILTYMTHHLTSINSISVYIILYTCHQSGADPSQEITKLP